MQRGDISAAKGGVKGGADWRGPQLNWAQKNIAGLCMYVLYVLCLLRLQLIDF